MFADLPTWVMGSSSDSFLPSLPMSLDFLSPWDQQATTYDADELRFIELNEDDEVVDSEQCEAFSLVELAKKLSMLTFPLTGLNDHITNYGIVVPQ